MTGTTPTRPTITDALAEQAIAAATRAARSQNTPITVVVVDESGVLKAARRMDDAPLVSLQTATNKAYAAAAAMTGAQDRAFAEAAAQAAQPHPTRRVETA